MHDLRRSFPLLRLRRTRRPARLADASRRHDHGRGDHRHQGLAPGPAGRRRRKPTPPRSWPMSGNLWAAAQPIDGTCGERYLDEPRRRSHQAAAGHPRRSALPSGLRVRPGPLLPVPDRTDARPADRCAGRHSANCAARERRTDRTDRTEDAGPGRRGQILASRTARSSSAKGSRRRSLRRPGFRSTASRSFRHGRW